MSKISIKAINNNLYGVNSYVIISGSEAIIIDAPEVSKSDVELNEYKEALNGIIPKFIVYTHGHFDHIGGAEIFRNVFGSAKHLIHKDDLIAFTEPRYNASTYFGNGKVYYKADTVFKDGDVINVGGSRFLVIHTPGHTRGGCCFYNEEDKILITGDTLFTYGIGRSDLEGGDMSTLLESIGTKLFILDNDTLIYPGHGEYATILGERKKMGII